MKPLRAGLGLHRKGWVTVALAIRHWGNAVEFHKDLVEITLVTETEFVRNLADAHIAVDKPVLNKLHLVDKDILVQVMAGIVLKIFADISLGYEKPAAQLLCGQFFGIKDVLCI